MNTIQRDHQRLLDNLRTMPKLAEVIGKSRERNQNKTPGFLFRRELYQDIAEL